MNDLTGTFAGSTTRSARPEFFPTGGPLRPDRPGYVRRAIDAELDAALATGDWSNVTGAPGTGKTSLLLRVAQALREAERTQVALIDVSQAAERDATGDPARWLYAIAFRMVRQLRAGFDLQDWWGDHAMLGHPQRVLELFRELLLLDGSRRYVVLLDGIDELMSLPLGEAFLNGLRLAYDARTTDPDFQRLCVVTVGTGCEQFGHAQSAALPFAIARPLTAAPFTLGESLRLGPALGLPRQMAELAMQRIYDWVGGHPALTQIAARALAARDVSDHVADAVDRVFVSRIESGRDRQAQAVLDAIEALLINTPRVVREPLLVAMGRGAKGQRVLFDPASAAHDRLLCSGALRITPDGFLVPASRLMRRQFNAAWANRHLPMRYGGMLKALAVILACVVVPFWYRQVLPQPFAAAMTQHDASVAHIVDASLRLGRFPGYREDARRVATRVLERRAARSSDAAEMRAIAAGLSGVGSPGQAAAASRAFWARRATAAEYAGDRAGAVLGWIAALGAADGEARRRLGALVGEDLASLVGVIANGGPIDALAYRTRDRRFIVRTGTALTAWHPARDSTSRWRRGTTLVPGALATQAVVARFELPRVRPGQSPALELQIAHSRPGDIEVIVTTPGGDSQRMVGSNWRADDLPGRLAMSSEMLSTGGEPAGIWTVSVTDTRQGEAGSVVSVQLGGRPPVDGEREVALPDPVPVAARSVVLDRSGEQALAWPAPPGNRAAVWDLRVEEIVASFPVTPGMRYLGQVANGRHALLIDGADVTLRRFSDGGEVQRTSLERPIAKAWPSDSGRFVAVEEAARSPRLLIVDLEQDRVTASLAAGVAHERVVVADDGSHVAASDVDQVLRMWRADGSTPLAELKLEAPVKAMAFSSDVTRLRVQSSDGALWSWRFDGEPLVATWGSGAPTSVADDAQAGLSLVGSSRDGFRLHDFAEQRDRSLPVLAVGEAALLRVRASLAVVLQPGVGLATVWRPRLAALPTGTRRVRRAWLSDDAATIAFADAEDAFNVLRLDAGIRELGALDDGIRPVAHAEQPERVRFSPDGRYVLSVEATGLLRVQDLQTGELLPFITRAGRDLLDADFSADGRYFVLLRQRAVERYDTATGERLSRELRDVPLRLLARYGPDWLVSDADGRLYRQHAGGPAAEIGMQPLSLAIDPDATAMFSDGDRQLVTVAAGRLQQFDLVAGTAVGPARVLPGPVQSMRLARDGRHLVVRSDPWLTRWALGAFGLQPAGVRLLTPDMLAHAGLSLVGEQGDGVALLRGLDEPIPATLWFDARDSAPLTGDRDSLIARWRRLVALAESAVPALFE